MNTRIFNRDRGLNTCKASPPEKIMPLFTVGYLSRLYASDLGVARSYHNEVRIRTRIIVLRTLCIRAPENNSTREAVNIYFFLYYVRLCLCTFRII